MQETCPGGGRSRHQAHIPRLTFSLPTATVKEAMSWAEDQGQGSASGKSPGGFLKLEDELEGTRREANSQTRAQGGQSELGVSAQGWDSLLARCPEPAQAGYSDWRHSDWNPAALLSSN